MRDLPVGNGRFLINFDEFYQIRDVYFPHVGQENHSEGFPFRFGVWVDREFSWIHDHGWTRSMRYIGDTNVTDVTLENNALSATLRCNDTVAPDDDILLRRITITNNAGHEREFRIFLHHDFRIYENKVGDTAFYDPQTRSLIHYEKHRYFLIDTKPHFDQFATGRKAFCDTQGTWRDAEDGELHGGAITEGSVDSTIGISSKINAGESFEFYYWIAAGTSHSDVAAIQSKVHSRSPKAFIDDALELIPARIIDQHPEAELLLSDDLRSLYRRSLQIIATQTDRNGAIIAATDHDVTERATDHYSYLWPRDGAFIANALDVAGVFEPSRNFFSLCRKIVHPRGYFLQKYNPDGTVGSGWHAYWDKYRQRELYPIQEDETALVIWALGEHCRHASVKMTPELYHDLVVRSADFMCDFRSDDTHLPEASWNLWEDRLGIHTFTCSAVVGALRAAADIAASVDDQKRRQRYLTAADEIVVAMREHLYDHERGRFLRCLLANGDDTFTPDPTADASLFGIFYFGCFDIDDALVTSTMGSVEHLLWSRTDIGGVARFEGDGYMRESDGIIGNSWIICTLWLAEYYIAKARTPDDLDRAVKLLEWTVGQALPSGVLPEQIDPISGKHLSVSPLTWSHSAYVACIHSLLDRHAELNAK